MHDLSVHVHVNNRVGHNAYVHMKLYPIEFLGCLDVWISVCSGVLRTCSTIPLLSEEEAM